MKKWLLVLSVLAAIVGMAWGCSKSSEEKEKIAKMKGVWTVTNVNCPDIFAKKGGETKVFFYRDNYPNSYYGSVKKCASQVKPNWIVAVDEEGDYSFFPPATPAPVEEVATAAKTAPAAETAPVVETEPDAGVISDTPIEPPFSDSFTAPSAGATAKKE